MVTSFSLSRVTSHLHLMVTSRFLRQGSQVTHTLLWSAVVSLDRVRSHPHLLMVTSCFHRQGHKSPSYGL